MDIRTYTAFATVAGLQNITRAAERLNQTQSALSRQIKALEAHLGVRLIEKAGRNIRLTPAGERFLDHAEHLLSIQHRLKRDLGMQRQAPILLRLGVIETVSHTWLVPLMEWLRTKHPSIQYELNVEMTAALHQHFRRGEYAG